jgi:hypothetical protein
MTKMGDLQNVAKRAALRRFCFVHQIFEYLDLFRPGAPGSTFVANNRSKSWAVI